METKICTQCKIEKYLCEFNKDKTSKDRLHCSCRKCLKNYYLKHRKEIILKNKIYCARPEIRAKKNLYMRKYSSTPEARRKHNLLKKKYSSFLKNKIARNIRRRIYSTFKGEYKSMRTKELLGCSIESFKAYILSQCELGMTEQNYGLWVIDHIRPCASFDLKLESEQKACGHYTNLQPMWAYDNIIKSDSYTPNDLI